MYKPKNPRRISSILVQFSLLMLPSCFFGVYKIVPYTDENPSPEAHSHYGQTWMKGGVKHTKELCQFLTRVILWLVILSVIQHIMWSRGCRKPLQHEFSPSLREWRCALLCHLPHAAISWWSREMGRRLQCCSRYPPAAPKPQWLKWMFCLFSNLMREHCLAPTWVCVICA